MMVAKVRSKNEVVMDVTVTFDHQAATMDVAQKCLIETFGPSHNYISANKVFALEDAWVLPRVDDKNGGPQRFLHNAAGGSLRTIQFQAIVAANDPEYPAPAPAPKLARRGPPHGGSCGPTCPPDDDYMMDEKEELVPAPAPKFGEEDNVAVVPVQAPVQAPTLSQPHGGSCGPTCPPDDGAFKTAGADNVVSTPDDDPFETENDDIFATDDTNGTEQPVLSPVMAPRLAQSHGVRCGPTCLPNDDDTAEEVFAVDCEFCPLDGSDAGAIARVAAHREWTGLFCACLSAEDCTLDITGTTTTTAATK